MRFFAAVFFFAAAGYVYWYNQNHLDRLVLQLVLDVLVPSSKGDPFTQGRLTVNILVGIGTLFFLRDFVGWLRENRGVRKE